MEAPSIRAELVLENDRLTDGLWHEGTSNCHCDAREGALWDQQGPSEVKALARLLVQQDQGAVLGLHLATRAGTANQPASAAMGLRAALLSPESSMQSTQSPDAATLTSRIPFFTRQASRWERLTDAFRREWDQTRADFSQDGRLDLGVTVEDTLRQAAGVERTKD